MKKLLLFTLLISLMSYGNVKSQEEEDGFTFGGAVRYNLISTNYESSSDATDPQFTWDTWRLNVDGSKNGVDLSFEYRFYPTFNTHFIHHGFLGYAFSDDVYMELGVTQVPFGITTYASHSWWFQGAYYVGLEDDYDMGINFDINLAEKLDLSVAYFRQAEPQGPGFAGVDWSGPGAGRYSYDITPSTDASIRELNQFNARLAYQVNNNWELGASAQAGGIYNSALDESELSTAFAGHVVGNLGNFNLKAQYTKYNYGAKNNAGDDLDIVQMGAYGFNYGVAAEASIYMAGLAYSIPVEFGPISNVQLYVDYTLIDKTNADFHDTQHLVPGMLITAGSIYTYVDYAMGKNQPWLTDDFGKGLGAGIEDPNWNTRFNINIGYYF
ncbi:MAG: hypothetical protein PF487_09700 [Bacteroidales bacterium]|jgi:hypothetical protein|nr:hypothetical protein [Bacteroidales bacterium]